MGTYLSDVVGILLFGRGSKEKDDKMSKKSRSAFFETNDSLSSSLFEP